MSRPTHPASLDHRNNIRWSCLIIQSSPASRHFIPLRSKCSPCSQIPLIYVLLFAWETKFHTHTKKQVKL
jgi:hypothetical protein